MASEPDSVPGDLDTDTPEGLVSFWLANISYAERKLRQFRTRGNQIIRRYKNMRSTAVPTTTNITVGQRRMNVLWANVETLKPVLFANTPKANVSRRNKDKDPVGRWASIVLERTLTNSMDMQPFDHVLEQDIENLLLPGYGCSMIEYVPQVENDVIGWQEAKLRYVHWKDQITNPARYWQEVWYWGYVSYLTRSEVRAAYGAKIAQEIVLDHKVSKDADDSLSKATVWCIWDSKAGKIIHVSTGYTKAPLAEMDPPVDFEGFFPIPRPLFATTATDSTIPVPDFDQYQDQADEIDMFTQRIYVLGRSLKLRGLYPGDMESVRQLMDDASDADLIPVANWAMLGERGGANGLVVWFPIEVVSKTLDYCYQARDKAMQAMYEITGIGDIVRGQSDPTETLGAQQLKAQFSGVRTRDRQRDVQRYICDHLRLMSSVIGQHFTLEVLQKMSGVQLLTQQQKQTIQQYQMISAQRQQQWQQQAQAAQQAGQPPPPQPQPIQPVPTPEMLEAMEEPVWEEVIALLRDEKLRGFIIDVETDSTIEADQIGQQQKAEQFLTSVTQYVAAWAQILPGAPALAPLAGEMLKTATRLFKMGDTIETQIDEAIDKMEGLAEQPRPPDPKIIAEQAKAQAAQEKSQAEIGKSQIDLQATQVKAGAEATKAKLSIVQTVAEHHAGMAKAAADLAVAQQQPQQPEQPQ